MNNQQTSPGRAKTVRYDRHITFGTVGDDDKDVRTENYIADGNIPTPDDNDSVSQPHRPLPPPEPPPPWQRRPKPGTVTSNIIRHRHVERTTGDEIKGFKTTTTILECAGTDKRK